MGTATYKGQEKAQLGKTSQYEACLLLSPSTVGSPLNAHCTILRKQNRLPQSAQSNAIPGNNEGS